MLTSSSHRWRCIEKRPHCVRFAILGANNDHIWGYVTIEDRASEPLYEVGTEYFTVMRSRQPIGDGPLGEV